MPRQYRGIIFPDRAESQREDRFSEYRVFLEHWDPLAEDLRVLFEGLALRGETRTLGIYGPQGVGKTMFASRLREDFEAAKRAYQDGEFVPDNSRLWDRMTGGGDLDDELISRAVLRTDIDLIEDEDDWVQRMKQWVQARGDRLSVIIADNAERPYFRKSLVNMTDIEYVQHGESAGALKLAAQRFVALCRGPLRGCLIVVLSNDRAFIEGFSAEVDGQHNGMMPTTHLPAPDSIAKETIVRINTNRLNPISYWYCLDKAGPEEKVAVYEALNGAETFPGSFAAVDQAIRTASATRLGRPAKKASITLAVLTDENPAADKTVLEPLGEIEYPDKAYQWFQHDWFSMAVYRSGWATRLLDGNAGGLLESEWNLRVLVLGRGFCAALLSGDYRVEAARGLLETVQEVSTPGTFGTTRDAREAAVRDLIDQWPECDDVELSTFWSAGQARSERYEGVFRRILPGYDTKPGGFIDQRPDYVVAPYVPCAILSAVEADKDAINNVIKRHANVFEFTATREFTPEYADGYLRAKLEKYVHTMREQ